MKLNKKLIIVSLFILAVGSIFLFWRLTKVKKVEINYLEQSPELLAKKKIIYFDDFNHPDLNKYREFLKSKGIASIADEDKQVQEIVKLINQISRLDGSELQNYPVCMRVRSGKAYCQVSSIKVSLLLSSLRVYTRHWHLKTSHQFIEYYNSVKNKWIVIDPFYGIQYAYKDELLSFIEVLKLVKSGIEAKGLLSFFNSPSMADLEEIPSRLAWQAYLAQLADYASYEDPQVLYGFLGNFVKGRSLSNNIKRLLRIFGRRNLMYQVE